MPNEKTTCYNCEEVLEANEIFEVEDKVYCETCFNRYFCSCDICSKIIKIEDSIHLSNRDETVCDSCFQDRKSVV